MRGLRPRVEGGLFRLDEVSDADVLPENRSGPDPGEGPHPGAGTDLRAIDVAVRAHDRAGTHGGIGDPRERKHLAALLQKRLSIQAYERMNHGVRLEPDPRAHARRGGIDDGGPGVERAIQAPAPLDFLGGRELAPRVDSPPLPPVLGLDRLDRAALRRQGSDRVGQVELPVDRVRRERADAPFEGGSREAIDAGVRLGQAPLAGRGVPDLDDALDAPLCVAHDASEVAGLRRAKAQEREIEALFAPPLDQPGQGRRGQEGRVTRENHHGRGAVARERGERAPDGVSRSERGVLHHDGHGPAGERLLDLFASRADDDDDLGRRDLSGRVEHGVEQRPAADPVENLRKRRPHPGSDSGGENDDSGRQIGLHCASAPFLTRILRFGGPHECFCAPRKENCKYRTGRETGGSRREESPEVIEGGASRRGSASAARDQASGRAGFGEPLAGA